MARLGLARHGTAWQASHGKAWLGEARRGVAGTARLGEAWLGLARCGRHEIRSVRQGIIL